MNAEEEYPPDKIRDASEVATRCVILLGVVAAGFEQSRPEIVAWIKEQRLWESVTPKEAAFLLAEEPTERHIAAATWRVESLHALLWALNRLPVLSPPTEQCDLDAVCAAMPALYSEVPDFISSALLRDEDSVEEFLGAIYHTHWEVVNARINHRPVPNGYDAGAVYERHYAYNWLTGYCNQDWDDISTDT